MSEIMAYIGSRTWAVRPGTFSLAGGKLSHTWQASTIEAAAMPQQTQTKKGVAVIRAHGVLTQRPMGGMWAMFFGGSSYESIGNQILDAAYNSQVDRTLVHFDTPGGEVYGIPSLIEAINEAKAKKPIVGIADSEAASAGYHIASQLDELIIAPGGQVGSIGAIARIVDDSGMMEQMGIKEHIIGYPEGKVQDWTTPVTDETIAGIDEHVKEYYNRFVSGVAKGRGVPVSKVNSDFGQGRMVMDDKAVAAGMADRIATMNTTLTRLTSSRARIGKRLSQAKHELRILQLTSLNQ